MVLIHYIGITDVDPDKVTFVNIAAEAKFSALAAKQMDVIFDYLNCGGPVCMIF